MLVKTSFAFLFLTVGTEDRPSILTRSILTRSSFDFIRYEKGRVFIKKISDLILDMEKDEFLSRKFHI